MRSNYLSHTSQFAHLTICSCDPVSVLGASRKFGDDGLWKSILAAGYPPKHRPIHTPIRWLGDLPPVLSWEEVLRRPKSRRAVQVSIFICFGRVAEIFRWQHQKSILAAVFVPKCRPTHTPRRWLEDLPLVLTWEELSRRPKSRRAVQVSISVNFGRATEISRRMPQKSILAVGLPPKYRPTHTPRRWLEGLPLESTWEELSHGPKSRDMDWFKERILPCFCRVEIGVRDAIILEKRSVRRISTRPTTAFKKFCPAVASAELLMFWRNRSNCGM